MKKKIAASVGAALIAGAFLVATAGADVTITIPTTAKQDAKLAKVLVQLNEERAALPAPLYVDIEEALTDILVRDVRRRISLLDQKEHRAIYDAWEATDEATKDQIRALLGVQ